MMIVNIKKLKKKKILIEYSSDMQDVYKNIEEYSKNIKF